MDLPLTEQTAKLLTQEVYEINSLHKDARHAQELANAKLQSTRRWIDVLLAENNLDPALYGEWSIQPAVVNGKPGSVLRLKDATPATPTLIPKDAA
jgi:hypothetical protein